MIPLSEAEEHESSSEVNTPLLIEEPRNEPQIDLSQYGRFAIFRRSRTAVICVTAVALFLDMIVYGIVVPILPLLVHERLGMDAKATGFLFGCYAIGLLGATPVFAVLSDRHRTRKVPMLFGMAGLGICTLLFGVSTSYWQLVLARIAQGASGGASWTISLAMLADRFGSGPKLGVVMGTVLSANTLGFITGPLVGGVLYEYWGQTAPFVFCAILSFFGFLIVCTVVDPIHLKDWDRVINIGSGELPGSNEENTESENGHLSMLSLMKEYNIVTVCLTVTVVASVFSGIEPTLPIHLSERFHADASQIGLIYVSVVVPTFISPLVGYLSYIIGQRNMIGIGTIMIAVASPLIALPNKLWLEIIPLLFFGAMYAIAITPTLPLLGQEVAQNGGGAYGRVYALWNMAYSVGMFVGPVIAGVMLEYYKFIGAMIAFSLISICVTPLSFIPSSWWERRRVGGGYSRAPLDDPEDEIQIGYNL